MRAPDRRVMEADCLHLQVGQPGQRGSRLREPGLKPEETLCFAAAEAEEDRFWVR